MTNFRYRAIAPTGEILQGVMEAATKDEVIAKLQEQGNVPIEAQPADKSAASIVGLLGSSSGISADQIGTFTEQLANLLGAGLPLEIGRASCRERVCSTV